VEAGPDYGSHGEGRWPEDMRSALGIPDSHDWRDAHGSLTAARIVGGCSATTRACWRSRRGGADRGGATDQSVNGLGNIPVRAVGTAAAAAPQERPRRRLP
jgi:hypothetical protein